MQSAPKATKTTAPNSRAAMPSAVIAGIASAVLEFVVVVFLAISVGTDILRSHMDNSWSLGSRACFSLWGRKRCGPHSHNPFKEMNKGFPTEKVLHTVNAAAVFDILGLVTTVVCFITCIMMACKCCSALVPIAFATVSVVFLIITIGCLLGVWYTKLGSLSQTRLTKSYSLGYGTILIVCGWCLQVVVLVLLSITFICLTPRAKADGEDEDEKGSKKGSTDKDKKEPEDRSTSHSET